MAIDYFSAFIIGLLGSGHCIGMCGGITTMLTSALNPIPSKKMNSDGSSTIQLSQHSSSKLNTPLALLLSYNVGRIFSYSLIGAIVGFSSSLAAKNMGLPLTYLRLIAAFFLILLGLYLGQWLMWLSKIEQVGTFLWKLLSPLSKRFIPVQSRTQALTLGMIWGWLPCGLVYSTLTWSLASASPISGALIMFCFGLGTLPALMSISLGTVTIKSLLVNTNFRKVMAIIIILYGIYSLLIAYRQLF
jgi:sulfite exporter TauE/SafE